MDKNLPLSIIGTYKQQSEIIDRVLPQIRNL